MPQHLPNLRALTLPDSGSIDGNDSLKILFGYLVGCLDSTADTSIVDCVVQSSKFLDRLFYAIIDRFFVGNIKLKLLYGNVWRNVLEVADCVCNRVTIEQSE